MLVDFYGKTPELINELQLQDYFLHRKNVDKWSPATMRICYSGIKFFFINVLKRKWHTLQLVHAKREQRLPTVLSTKEVRSMDYGTDYGTSVLDVLKLSSKLPISGLMSDDTARVTHEFVTPRYLATSAPV